MFEPLPNFQSVCYTSDHNGQINLHVLGNTVALFKCQGMFFFQYPDSSLDCNKKHESFLCTKVMSLGK
jgi:hypothetical protein